ncbi:MAG: S26 family signal peptidase, partial [Myxococcota bacterium]|nr:S26 family signal peptidase [Myxococcota bacterium]
VHDQRMLPNLLPADLLWVSLRREASAGDILLLRDQEGALVLRRLIAREGQRVARRAGEWSVDGQPLFLKQLGELDPNTLSSSEQVTRRLPVLQPLRLEHVSAQRGYQSLGLSPLQRRDNSEWEAAVPAKRLFVLCDNRPHCEGERWQLPVPLSLPKASPEEREEESALPSADQWAPSWSVVGVVIARLWPVSAPRGGALTRDRLED